MTNKTGVRPAPPLAPAARAGPRLRGAGPGQPGGPRKGEGKFAKKTRTGERNERKKGIKEDGAKQDSGRACGGGRVEGREKQARRGPGWAVPAW